MKDIYLLKYSVRGIKNLDEEASLSFFKKTLKDNLNTQSYNLKGIYGMNGSGKTAIVSSVDILKNIILDCNYLNNPIVQNKLDATINKKTQELIMEVEYITELSITNCVYKYKVIISKDITGKYVISYEEFAKKGIYSKNGEFSCAYIVENGIITYFLQEGKMYNEILSKTANLLSTASLPSLFWEKFFITDSYKDYQNQLSVMILSLMLFGRKIHVCFDKSDEHEQFLLNNTFLDVNNVDNNNLNRNFLIKKLVEMNRESLNTVFCYNNIVKKEIYGEFEQKIEKLFNFLRIFKNELKGIKIDKKENKDIYICSLIMVYDSYEIHSEFESTGIKKLIKLFTYISKMAQGDIVFIDELDSNLHDVYLCALLEYLMGYGKGQLCFTTHNIGPMDVLKNNKKSIDFLSTNGKIYPWVSNGNYSPSKLYKNGMIEGSPFNIDSIDFIGIFDEEKEA